MVSKANADVDQATAGASGAAVGADQQTAGATGGTFSETGHKAATDVNTEEAISSYNGFAVQRALRSQDVLDNFTNQLIQNAITAQAQMLETANMLSKRTLQQFELADDRKWNVNETDAYSVQALKAVADLLRAK